MKEDELRKHSDCSICKSKIGHKGSPIFWTLDVKCHGIDFDSIKRQDGLTAMLGGNAFIARHMGTNSEMTKIVDEKELTLCLDCINPVLELIEKCEYKEQEK